MTRFYQEIKATSKNPYNFRSYQGCVQANSPYSAKFYNIHSGKVINYATCFQVCH